MLLKSRLLTATIEDKADGSSGSVSALIESVSVYVSDTPGTSSKYSLCLQGWHTSAQE